jgi:acyl-coenzyme A thioesterase PaaI-like protein
MSTLDVRRAFRGIPRVHPGRAGSLQGNAACPPWTCGEPRYNPRPVQPRTHLAIDRRLCGEPLDAQDTAEGTARVGLTTVPEMAADEAGLVHGGFVFGLADYAAMLAVNHPNVVLGSAAVRFLRPVAVGERLVAEARREETSGRRSRVTVEVRRAGSAGDAAGAGGTAGPVGTAGADPDAGGGGEAVMSGEFICLTLDRHVLQPPATGA